MFTIVISEKGGAERRESFDNGEINVGRVQGNDLMLPKGNVSKQHARLLFRDGRFIVTDLKSTNGTYVNGRKISQATIVREGDKIYIGDFVLRLETGQAAGSSDAARPAPDDDAIAPSSVRSPPRVPTPPPLTAPPSLVVSPPALSVTPPPLPAQGLATSPSAVPPVGLPVVASGPSVAPMQRSAAAEQASTANFALERDAEEGDNQAGVRGPPALPPAARRPAVAVESRARSGPVFSRDRGATVPQRVVAPAVAPAGPTGPTGPTRSAPQIAVPPAAPKPAPRENAQQAARRLALITLVDRVGDTIDLAPLRQSPAVHPELARSIEQTVVEQAKAMQQEGEAPEGIDLDLLARDAVRELVGLGPLGSLLEDDEVAEVHVARPDYVVALKKGQQQLADPAFSSEEAVARVVARLVAQSGEPLRPGELVVERRLARGTQLVAIAPPASTGWVITVRKRRRVEATLDELVRGGAMSRSMGTFLEACVVGRANILVVGSAVAGVSQLMAALASAALPNERIAVLQDADEIVAAQGQAISLNGLNSGARGEEAVRGAIRLGVDRLVVASFAGATAAATVDAIGEGAEGVIAGAAAPSLRPALARLAAQIAIARPGASIDAAREALGESFDVAVEVSRTADGRIRVARVVELAGGDAKGVVARDVFVLSGDGPAESAYVATGTPPRVAADLSARGVKVDPSLFKRAR